MRVCVLLAALLAAAATVLAHSASTAAPTDLPLDWRDLAQAAGMAAQAYCDNVRTGDVVGDAEVLWHKFIGVIKQRVVVFHSERLGVAVAFEGTQPYVVPRLHDVNVRLAPPKGWLADVLPADIQIHAGFQNAYLQVAQDMVAAVKDAVAVHNATRVTCTGHSLGAALGVLAGAHLDRLLDADVHVYTFGTPRIGDEAWADYIDSRLAGRFFYVANGRDWVPHAPPTQLGYWHPSGQIWISPANSDQWRFFPGQENVHGAESETPKISFEDHTGVHFHTYIGLDRQSCPARVNDM